MSTKETRQAKLDQAIGEYSGTQRQFADMVFTDPSFLSQMKLGRRPVPDDLARRVERALNKKPFWMDTDPATDILINEPPGQYNAHIELLTPSLKVPILSPGQAFNWRVHMDEYKKNGNYKSLFSPEPHGINTFAMQIYDDSMTAQHPAERSYPKGAYIFIDPDIKPTSSKNVAISIKATNEVICRRLAADGDVLRLIPINSTSYRAFDLDPEKHIIIGTVVGTYAPE